MRPEIRGQLERENESSLTYTASAARLKANKISPQRSSSLRRRNENSQQVPTFKPSPWARGPDNLISEFAKNNYSMNPKERRIEIMEPGESPDSKQFVSLSHRNSLKSSPLKDQRYPLNSVERRLLRESSQEVAKIRSIINEAEASRGAYHDQTASYDSRIRQSRD